jgi:multidrug resistance efflux pump
LPKTKVRAPFASTLTNLTEIDVVNIKEGQLVEIMLDEIPDVTLEGSILSTSQN